MPDRYTSSRPADLGLTYDVGIISGGAPKLDFLASLDQIRPVDSIPPYKLNQIITNPCGPYLDDGRNKVALHFLDSDADWLVWIDDDIKFTPDDIRALLTGAIDNNVRFASGLYANLFGGRKALLAMDIMFHTEVPEDRTRCGDVMANGEVWVNLNPDDPRVLHGEPFSVAAVGAGFMVTHRSLLVDMMHGFAPDPPMIHPISLVSMLPQPFFVEPTVAGSHWGEDLGFCARASTMGEPVLILPNIQVGHVKPCVITCAANGL
jgi:hypothetical protein